MHDDSLTDFVRRGIGVEGETRAVYVAGQGPAVIVMAEMPGISPHVARFARWVRDAGFTVYMPSLFGRDGAYPEAEAGLAVLKRACVSAEHRRRPGPDPFATADRIQSGCRAAEHEARGDPVGLPYEGDSRSLKRGDS